MGDVILTPTEYSCKLLINYGIKKPIITLSNGIDIQQFVPDAENRKIFRQKYNLSEDKKVVLSVGHYIERKGILEFMKWHEKCLKSVFMVWIYKSEINSCESSKSDGISTI